MSFDKEIREGNRFGFGKNWISFSKNITQDKISMSEDTLKEFFDVKDFNNSSFIDVGCGSGLFSLAAHKLGAKVKSFDFDINSVICTQEIKKDFSISKETLEWNIEEGSILDSEYIESLGQHDYVYSWGVLHHTGDMHQAFKNVTKLVKADGKLFIAIYNDQGMKSKIWKLIKKLYCKNIFFKFFITIVYSLFILIPQYIKYFLLNRTLVRGMSLYHDMFDWLGGYPFEVGTPKEIKDYFLDKGFRLIKVNLVGKRLGCNEFVFQKEG